MLLSSALYLAAMLPTSILAGAGPECKKGIPSQHCVYTVGDAYLAAKNPVSMFQPYHVLASSRDKYGESAFLIEDFLNGSFGLQCKKSSRMETFVFLFQGNANHLFSRTANTGVAKAYFDDGVKRGKLTPGTEMISSKDGVDIIGDCP